MSLSRSSVSGSAGRTSSVVASVRADSESHEGMIDIPGPEAHSLEEKTVQISSLNGRELRYEHESVEESRRWRSTLKAPACKVVARLGSCESIAAGDLAVVSEHLLRITGRFDLGSSFVSIWGLFDRLP